MSAEDYDPPLTSSGEHILKFTSRNGEFIILVCIPDLHSNVLFRCRRFPWCHRGSIGDMRLRWDEPRPYEWWFMLLMIGMRNIKAKLGVWVFTIVMRVVGVVVIWLEATACVGADRFWEMIFSLLHLVRLILFLLVYTSEGSLGHSRITRNPMKYKDGLRYRIARTDRWAPRCHNVYSTGRNN